MSLIESFSPKEKIKKYKFQTSIQSALQRINIFSLKLSVTHLKEYEIAVAHFENMLGFKCLFKHCFSLTIKSPLFLNA
jgi:hypothetical protein